MSSRTLRSVFRPIGLSSSNPEISARQKAARRLNDVPRGNTCAGVNREIITYILENFETRPESRLLDMPCGEGAFLDTVRQFFPSWEITGSDLRTPECNFQHEFIHSDASKNAPLSSEKKFDVVTCISGIMEFDNTLAFFERLSALMLPDGICIVTNDNILTVRDRLLYLFFGRFGQYPFSTDLRRPTWKIVPLQNIIRILNDAGFDVISMKYVPVRTKDWLWSPLAAILLTIGKLNALFAKTTGKENPAGSFRSLLSRHYFLVCRKKVML